MASKRKPQRTRTRATPSPVSLDALGTLDVVQAVVDLFTASDLGELEVEDAKIRVRVSRLPPVPAVVTGSALPPAPPPPRPVVSHPHVAGPAVPAPGGQEAGTLISSPFVGTFYRAPAPHAPPFVDVGTVVKKGQTLCIVEAMKLMNEIESEVAGKVVEILVENGTPVEFGQKLFRVLPA
jgi:acetyl-CoA carboxylase biotin carboxyl carrier protein